MRVVPLLVLTLLASAMLAGCTSEDPATSDDVAVQAPAVAEAPAWQPGLTLVYDIVETETSDETIVFDGFEDSDGETTDVLEYTETLTLLTTDAGMEDPTYLFGVASTYPVDLDWEDPEVLRTVRHSDLAQGEVSFWADPSGETDPEIEFLAPEMTGTFQFPFTSGDQWTGSLTSDEYLKEYESRIKVGENETFDGPDGTITVLPVEMRFLTTLKPASDDTIQVDGYVYLSARYLYAPSLGVVVQSTVASSGEYTASAEEDGFSFEMVSSFEHEAVSTLVSMEQRQMDALDEDGIADWVYANTDLDRPAPPPEPRISYGLELDQDVAQANAVGDNATVTFTLTRDDGEAFPDDHTVVVALFDLDDFDLVASSDGPSLTHTFSTSGYYGVYAYTLDRFDDFVDEAFLEVPVHLRATYEATCGTAGVIDVQQGCDATSFEVGPSPTAVFAMARGDDDTGLGSGGIQYLTAPDGTTWEALGDEGFELGLADLTGIESEGTWTVRWEPDVAVAPTATITVDVRHDLSTPDLTTV